MWGDKIRKILKNVLSDSSGATAIEYGLIAALIAVAIITGVGTLGTSTKNSFDTVSTKWQASVDAQTN